MSRLALILLPSALVLSACCQTREAESAKVVVGKAVAVSVPERNEPAEAQSMVVDEDGDRTGEEEPSWALVDRPGRLDKVIEIKREIRFDDLARELGLTVDDLNALNGFRIKPDTVLATGSVLCVSKFSPFA